MSRSGYSDDCDGWALIRWRGAVKAAIKGRRGQAFLRETLAALDAMPEKRLVPNELESEGEFCTLGAVGHRRGVNLATIDPEDRESVAVAFGISEALAAEIMFENDERHDDFTWVTAEICGPVRPHQYEQHTRTRRVDSQNQAEARWSRMRAWVASHIKKIDSANGEGAG